MLRRWCPLAVILFLVIRLPGLRAQSNVRISGVVLDATTREPLIAANVVVVGTSYGDATDTQGRFRIQDLPSGRYQLAISRIGYRRQVQTIEVTIDLPAEIRVALEPTPLLMPEVVVTSDPYRLPHPSAAVTIISRQVIERSQAASVAELLDNVAGLQVFTAGGVGHPASVSIRGSASNQVLVLLDGQRINTAQSGSVDVSRIPLNWIERVEIIKGGSSVLHGGDAIGGVINIITRHADRDTEDGLRLDTTMGQHGTLILTPALSTRLGQVAVHATYQRTSSEADFAYRTFADPPKNSIIVTRVRENDWVDSHSLFTKLNWRSASGFLAELSAQYYSAAMGMPGPETQLTPQASQSDRRDMIALRAMQPLATHSRLEASAYFHTFLQEYESPPPGAYLFHNRHRNRAAGGELLLLTRLAGYPVTSGYSFRRELLASSDLIRPSRSLGRKLRTTHSLFSQLEVGLLHLSKAQPLRLRLVPGYRIDLPSDYEAAHSPKLGLVLTRGSRWPIGLKANVGKSYRAPTLNSLFWVPDAFAVGNPHLRPERATNYDVGLGTTLPLAGELTADVTWYGSEVRDIVVWRRQFDGRFRPENLARAATHGREDHLRWRLGKGWCVLELNHTFLDAVNRSGERVTDGKQLVFRPRHTTSLLLANQLGALHTELRRRWVSKRFIREANTKYLDSYQVTDVSASLYLSIGYWNLTLGARINNVTDENYRLIEGYPMPGREWRLSLEVGY